MSKIVQDYSKSNWRERRNMFLDYFGRVCEYRIKEKIFSNWNGMKLDRGYNLEGFEVCSLLIKPDESVLQTNWETYGGYLNLTWNTRKITSTEWRTDFDSLNKKLNSKAVEETCNNLKKKGVHFCVFFAEGMKSPHIIIYDFLPEGTDEDTARTSRLLFAEEVVPEKYFDILDKQMFNTGKTCCLEFSKHWKTGKMLKLVYEHTGGLNESS